MKKGIVLLLCAFMSVSLFSCGFISYQSQKIKSWYSNKNYEASNKRVDRFVKKLHKKADTVYMLSDSYYLVALKSFNRINQKGISINRDLIWYHKDNFIYSFTYSSSLEFDRLKINKPIPAIDVDIANDNIDQYFYYLDKYFIDPDFYGIPCFEPLLDGDRINIYIKNQQDLDSGIDLRCLFSRKYPENSLPYKLQYDFSKLLPEYLGRFKNLYPDVE